jgi:hypothetical protein
MGHAKLMSKFRTVRAINVTHFRKDRWGQGVCLRLGRHRSGDVAKYAEGGKPRTSTNCVEE